MESCKPAPTPVVIGTKLSKDDEGSYVNPTLLRRLVNNLMYLVATRSNIMNEVSLISRFMESSKESH